MNAAVPKVLPQFLPLLLKKINIQLCIYLTGLSPRSVSLILLYAHKIIEKEFKELTVREKTETKDLKQVNL
jgi:hypothetical protein